MAVRSLVTQPVHLYTSTGAMIQPTPAGSYTCTIIIRHTTTPSAGAAVWAMRLDPNATVSAYIRQIMFAVSFDGTASAGKSLGYDWMRFSGATHTGGSSTLSLIKKNNNHPASQIIDARLASGAALTDTNVVYEAAFATVRIPVAATGWENVSPLPILSPCSNSELVLAPGEGLAMQLNQAAIVGQVASGFVEWDER